MRKCLFILFALISLQSFAQDVIYLKDGTKLPGKISEIGKDSVKFRNLANPSVHMYSIAIGNLAIAFNKLGNYLIFDSSYAIGALEKDAFINPRIRPRNYDIVIGTDGKLRALNITDENETEIAAIDSGKNIKLLKQSIEFLIRKNGEHVFISSPDQTLPWLAKLQNQINELAYAESSNQQGRLAVKSDSSQLNHKDEILEPDMAEFGAKALDKATEFTGYLKAITTTSTNRDVAKKNIDQALDLFLDRGENVRIEVSNPNSPVLNKYKILDYLNRLLIKSGEFDKVDVEFAEINYASKFHKGVDGNYYATVTFVQKFKGFIDGNLVYGDRTKRIIIIVLKHYEKQINGQKVSRWDLYLGDIGTLETKRI